MIDKQSLAFFGHLKEIYFYTTYAKHSGYLLDIRHLIIPLQCDGVRPVILRSFAYACHLLE